MLIPAVIEKNKQIILLVILAIIVVADLAIIGGWQYNLLSRYSRDVSSKEKSIAALERDIRNLDKNKQEMAELDEKNNNFKIMIVDEKDIAVLIEKISNLADDSGVKIIQIKPLMDNSDLNIIEAKDSKFREIEIQIVGKADFHQLGNFVSSLESASNFFKVSSLDIESQDKDYLVQNIRLSLTTFVNIGNSRK
ncbi:MAG: type 4a pilus biogenesis protein PilO [Candidatus Omnitrophica bacterium]|nr:type 4a pilus biogenesis protein PilO [Candidatus Omnitrophota bacterium]MDD5352733.1 type 4a pilus biogenesis protein PilO [Candidatus Omnitrophota bacterium]MDD5550332.1 type 4a pilus biogenesis protein PilO [Candidatus Omnitrophota bacterium]